MSCPTGLPPMSASALFRLPARSAPFRTPTKRITDQTTLRRFKDSVPYKAIVGYVQTLADACLGRRISDECEMSPKGSALCDALATMGSWIDEIPPHTQAMRYGNKAFKEWHARLKEFAPVVLAQLIEGCVPVEEASAAVAELATYLTDSFGNELRIDYGTGHELSFLILIMCLERLGAFDPEERPSLVLRVFNKYLGLMRQLQTTYWLEPAGSHGVWGLDDYQFLPFLLGAAQLVNDPQISPAAVLDAALLEQEHEEYLYLAAVRFVRQVKKGPFSEHSPYLHDISGLASWQIAAAGLMRMYEGEVLGKLPVVQHLPFGSLLEWEGEGPSYADTPRPPPMAPPQGLNAEMR